MELEPCRKPVRSAEQAFYPRFTDKSRDAQMEGLCWLLSLAHCFQSDNHLPHFTGRNSMKSFTNLEVLLPFNQAAPHPRNYYEGGAPPKC